MEQIIEEAWSRGEEFTARRWLDALPCDVLQNNPVLLLFQARFSVIRAEPVALLADLDRVEYLLTTTGNTDPALWSYLTGMRAFHATFMNDDDRAILLAEKALAQLPPDTKFLPAVIRILLASISMERGETTAHPFCL